MSLIKREYKDRETVITAENLNDIQDAILDLETRVDDNLYEVQRDIAHLESEAAKNLVNMQSAIAGVEEKANNNLAQAQSDIADLDTKTANSINDIKSSMADHESMMLGNLKEMQDSISALEAISNPVIGEAYGSTITVADASDLHVYGLTLYGKTTQNGTPTPDSPVELVSIGGPDYIGLSVYGEHEENFASVTLPSNFAGIPVSSGGNYTDENGQQWICDEIDLGRGVYVQRTGLKVFSGTEPYEDFVASFGFVSSPMPHNPLSPIRCTHGIQDVEVSWANDLYVRFKVTHFNVTGLSEFKSFITEQYDAGTPLTILYVLNAPIETPLSDEDIASYKYLHTYRGETTVSNDVSANMKLEYVMDTKKYIDSLFKGPSARISNVTLLASSWVGEDSPYSQVVTIDGITEYSKVDLLPSIEQLAIFHDKDLAFVTENDGGVVTVYALGDKPTNDYTIQVSITEVSV